MDVGARGMGRGSRWRSGTLTSFPTALVLLTKLMVASQEKHSGRVHDLECKEQADHLQLVLSPVHEIAIEDIPTRLIPTWVLVSLHVRLW
jgi:hypothetical protein